VFKAMEDAGRVRRGYFVEGLGAAQFALPGAVDRLRAERDPRNEPEVVVLAAADPANPYGAAIPWPRRGDEARHVFQRAAHARVVLVDGEPVLYVERGGRAVVTFPAFDTERSVLAVAALAAAAAASDRPRPLERIDSRPPDQSPHLVRFLDAGFVRGYRGLTMPAAARPRSR
jgi:ATP-dependent Lhr-like helicase